MKDPTEFMAEPLCFTGRAEGLNWECETGHGSDMLLPAPPGSYLVVLSGQIVGYVVDKGALPKTGTGWCLDCKEERSFTAR